MQKPRLSRSRTNLYLDAGLAVVFLLTMGFRFTGTRNHELLGLALGGVIIIHLLLHRRWIVDVTRRFFAPLFHVSRLNYVLNLLMLMDVVVVIVTGILISRTLGLNLQLGGQLLFGAYRVHIISSSLAMALVGLHIARHWKWILAHTRKYIIRVHLPVREVETIQTHE
jgi:hypothetical protein